jgi:two-component system NtrC family response regulator
MSAMIREAMLVAPSRLPILLTGPSGTGKSQLASAIHDASGRPGSFEPVDCAAIEAHLLRAELLGAVRGAYTGCDRDRDGALQRAHRGTLFLDEIGEMPTADQARLLKVVEEQRFRRVGGGEPVQVDVRLVAATLRGEDAIREDLRFRLGGVRLELPALAARPEDIAPIVQDRLDSHHPRSSITPAAIAWLESQPWPGNVRELLNAVDCSAVRAGGAVIDVAHLQATDPVEDPLDAALRHPGATIRSVARTLGRTEAAVTERVRALVHDALARADGSDRAAARLLGWPRSTFQNRRRLLVRSRPPEGWPTRVAHDSRSDRETS